MTIQTHWDRYGNIKIMSTYEGSGCLAPRQRGFSGLVNAAVDYYSWACWKCTSTRPILPQ